MVAGRNEKGQFAKGTTGNPKGRPRREVEQEYLNVTFNAVTSDEWRKVIAAMVRQAQKGNVAAATWLGNYVLGKPQDSLDITSGGDKLEIVVRREARNAND